MTPTQYKIFVWAYTLVDSMIGGAATSLAIAFTALPSGTVVDTQTLARTALVAAATHAVYYLRKSPLPALIANRQGQPPSEAPPAAARQVVITEIDPVKGEPNETSS